MTHTGIECFLAICRHKTGNAAAQALFITQPSLSARLTVLEKEVGKQLAGNKVQVEIDKQSMKKAQKAIDELLSPLKKWFK